MADAGSGAGSGSGFELRAHESTYSSFIGLIKYGAIASFAIAAIVVVILAS